jgi:type I restriction enzyme S subunit
MSNNRKHGYRKTSIGLVPKHWEVKRLGEVAFESKVRNSTRAGDRALSGVLKHKGIVPMRDRVKGVSTDRCLVVEPNAFAYNPMRLNIGSIARNMADRAVIVSPDYVVFETDKNQLLPSYLDHVRRAAAWEQFVTTSGDGSVRVRIYFEHLAQLHIPLPPLVEQERITSILDTADDKLDVIARQIAITQTLKQGLMQTLFSRGVGTQNANGRWVPHTEFRESAFGEIPVSWNETTLGVICAGVLKTGPFGSQLHAAEYQDEGIPVLMPKDLINGRANLGTAARISNKRATDLAKHTLVKGDLLFSRRGDVARFALIDERSEGALCGTGCLKAKLTSEHSPAFFSHLLQLDTVRAWLEQNAVGQTMPNMNTSILSSLPLIAPTSLDEEQEIADILDSVDAKMRLLLAKQSNYQSLKRGLMQKLLTGEWRVKSDNLLSEILTTDLTVDNLKLPTKANVSLMAEAI